MEFLELAACDRKEIALKGSRFHDGVPGALCDRPPAVSQLGDSLSAQAEGGNDEGARAAREKASDRSLFKLARSLRKEDKLREARNVYILLSKSTNPRFAAAAKQAVTWLSVVLVQKNGEHAPFEWLVTSHQDNLMALFRWMLDGEGMGEIDDLMQRTFLKAWQRLGQLRNPRRFTHWLRRIARNLGHDHLRQRQGQVAHLQMIKGESRHLEESGSYDSLQDLLEIVPHPIDREILYLRFVEGLTYPEIARELEIDIGADAIRKRVDKVERMLRERLE